MISPITTTTQYSLHFFNYIFRSVFTMSSAAAVTPSSNNMNGNGNKSLSPHETSTPVQAGQPQLPQQALQNLQRLLQSQLANVNPLQLQQALQRHQQQQMVDAGRKQLEQMLQQLQVSYCKSIFKFRKKFKTQRARHHYLEALHSKLQHTVG